MTTLTFPDKTRFLFKPSRYKVLWGGRGSGKSWACARALLVLAAQKPTRILCTREVQKSIADSVHKLLADQCAAIDELRGFYEVLQTTIRGRNGSEFIFAGLKDHTIDSIKSYEGVDIVWIEEGHAVTKRSWDVLLPTIRKPGSEIWVTFNPQLETDETYRRFVSQPPPDCVSVKMNYSDNPWFPSVLEAERQHAMATMKPAEYRHIWEGECMPAVEGAIYFDEISRAESEGRIRDVPPDELLKVHTFWDLGWNDSTAIILAQRSASEIRIIDYIEGSQRKLSDYAAQLNDMRLNWGNDFLPHDGFARTHHTGMSAEEILRQYGRNVYPEAPGRSLSVEGGILAVRQIFPRLYFDKTRCAPLLEHIKRYRRRINASTGVAGEPAHDDHSHAADALRYLALSLDYMSNSDWGGAINYKRLAVA